MNFKRKMVQKHCFVSFEQEPIFYSSNYCLFDFCLLVFVGDLPVDVVSASSWFRGSWLFLHAWFIMSNFNLLDDFLVFEVNFIHFCRHFQFIFCPFLGNLHTILDSLARLFFSKQFVFKNLFPWNSIFGVMLKHAFEDFLECLIVEFLRILNHFLIHFHD